MQIKRKLNRMMKKTTWKTTLSLFRMFTKSAAYFNYPVIGPVVRRLVNLEPEAHTQAYTLNINADVSDMAKGVVLPIDMMKKLAKEASYRAIMNKCLCRSAFECKNFPHDHACIFIGEGARGIVKNGIGREATVKQALAHIDKGAELGLIGQALWVEVERVMMGIKREKDVAHWLEICFCCPCCCGTFKLMKSSDLQDIRNRFQSIGWKARVDDGSCIQCQLCIDRCPVEAISLNAGHIMIDEQKCLGCGFCAAGCPQEAIKLHFKGQLLDSIQDYFSRGGLKVEV
ncbi:MAG TPA: 4Fe-4S binding protein [Deltaproteobacteria bacterium]|nr:4Fe-4S binding protein [Deltaproteobacteria bacterium]HPR55155.1 4Fe-4S binding protein [Deltaproteobacteria bacterium]HXK47932.1 4Fe-4S binding protein [Deltaproteobacteria bacterium]